ncbi:hypothetical protein [Falsiroseomonas sp. E2-1-a4]|uniref:hypothetical protein n=1 Tax=Falsiroseomonas sp. E2-1-a4 TaxID=3239299 RepID=UPI003F416191
MRRQDWLILAVLLAAALWFGWPRIQQMPIARYLHGECATPRTCPAPGLPAEGVPGPGEFPHPGREPGPILRRT